MILYLLFQKKNLVGRKPWIRESLHSTSNKLKFLRIR